MRAFHQLTLACSLLLLLFAVQGHPTTDYPTTEQQEDVDFKDSSSGTEKPVNDDVVNDEAGEEVQEGTYLGLSKEELVPNCRCGVKGTEMKIVGGKPTDPNEFPWTVGLALTKSIFDFLLPGGNSPHRFIFCGGTLINSRYVVTAAHCVRGMNPRRLEVVLNEHDLMQEGETVLPTTVIKPKRLIIHSGYNPKNVENDIALIELSTPVALDQKTFFPACLSNSEETYVDEIAIAAGWGTTTEGGSLSKKLLKVDVTVIENDECEEQYPDMIVDSMLCAANRTGGKDACQGDSGGPLITKDKDTLYTLIGIVSWGAGCGREGKSGVYTRVNDYVDWIVQNTKGSQWCTRDKPRFPPATSESTSPASSSSEPPPPPSEEPTSSSSEAPDTSSQQEGATEINEV